MQMGNLKRIGTRMLATTALGAFIAAAPVSVDVDVTSGVFALQPAVASAKGGNSGSGGGGNSGSGGGGNSGSGSSHDDDDDSHSGSGHGGDDNDNDHDDDEEHAGGHGGGGRDNDRGPKVEISGDNIEITFADGTKEEIENGVYERKNAAGRTVEERPATQADIERLTAAAGGGAPGGTGGGSAPGGGPVGTPAAEREVVLNDGTKIEVSGNNIEVKYSDGWKEQIEAGRYELKDPAGNTVVERPATAGDRTRLQGQVPG